MSNTWGGYQSALLADQGIDVTEFIPVENADGWQDAWQIVKGTPNMDCAYKWLNFAVSEAGQCGAAAARRLGHKRSDRQSSFWELCSR